MLRGTPSFVITTAPSRSSASQSAPGLAASVREAMVVMHYTPMRRPQGGRRRCRDRPGHPRSVSSPFAPIIASGRISKTVKSVGSRRAGAGRFTKDIDLLVDDAPEHAQPSASSNGTSARLEACRRAALNATGTSRADAGCAARARGTFRIVFGGAICAPTSARGYPSASRILASSSEMTKARSAPARTRRSLNHTPRLRCRCRALGRDDGVHVATHDPRGRRRSAAPWGAQLPTRGRCWRRRRPGRSAGRPRAGEDPPVLTRR